MDPIIRSPALSPLPRELRRPGAVAAAAALPSASTGGFAHAAATPATAAPAQQAAQEAQAALENARQQAALRERDAEIVRLRGAGEQAALVLEQRRAEAEQRGYASGEAKGEAAAMALLQAQVDRVKALVFQIGQARQQVMSDAEDALVEIVFAAICRVLGEHGAGREHVRRMVQEAAGQVRERESLVVRLHPDDAALLRLDSTAAAMQVRISADAGVKLGGCLVDSTSGTLDARFDTQIELLAQALLAARAGRHALQDNV
jgi:flagellar assembly protein FliH